MPLRGQEIPEGVHVLACEVDEVRRSITVALDDGTITSFSIDYALYGTELAFKKQIAALGTFDRVLTFVYDGD